MTAVQEVPDVDHRYPTDPVTELAASVQWLASRLPKMLDACTDPQGADVAELLYDVQQARIKLQEVERDVEAAAVKALLSDQVHTPTIRAERYRSADRKEWQHDDWKRDVRNKALQALGLKGAQAVITADGEAVDASVLHALLSTVQNVHAAAAPKTGKADGLRSLGLSAEDYCTTFKGVQHVRVMRTADESKGNDDA